MEKKMKIFLVLSFFAACSLALAETTASDHETEVVKSVKAADAIEKDASEKKVVQTVQKIDADLKAAEQKLKEKAESEVKKLKDKIEKEGAKDTAENAKAEEKLREDAKTQTETAKDAVKSLEKDAETEAEKVKDAAKTLEEKAKEHAEKVDSQVKNLRKEAKEELETLKAEGKTFEVTKENSSLEKVELSASQISAAARAKGDGLDVDKLLKEIETETNTVELAKYATYLSQTTTRGPKVREAFRKMLKNEDPFLREQTLMALEDYPGVAFLLDDMVPLLNDPEEDVRDSAMTTIADYVENRRKFEVLIDALDNQYEDVRENAIFNLGFYTDQDFPTAEEWKKWWAENKNTFKP